MRDLDPRVVPGRENASEIRAIAMRFTSKAVKPDISLVTCLTVGYESVHGKEGFPPMPGINYPRFRRILDRCAAMAARPGMNQLVVVTYNELLKPLADAYVALETAINKKESALGKEMHEAVTALRDFDSIYAAARAMAAGFVKGLSVPDTLKSLATYTDKKIAIETLLDAIDDHINENWAKTLIEGDFGKRAPLVIKEIDEATNADRDLVNARAERAKTYGPTYEAYLSCKRVVRTSLGPASKEYRSIHIRSNGTVEDDPGEPTPPVPTPPTPPVPPNP